MKSILFAATAITTVIIAQPALAQDNSATVDDPFAGSVYSGDFLSVGIGAAVSPSYSGSDDYVISPAPIIQGSLFGIGISPRAAGLTLDFIPDRPGAVGLDLGVSARLRSDRATQIDDEVVELYGDLDRAIEVGPSVGVSFPGVLNPYDSLSISTDVMWDVNGAHGGMAVSPSLSYFTPLSRGIAASLSLGAEWADSDFHDYYFAVRPTDYTGPGASPLPAFEPDGGGFTSAGANLLLAFDANGNLADGGLGFVLIGGYSRMLGDAADTPFTSIRGTADQFLGAVGVGYTF